MLALHKVLRFPSERNRRVIMALRAHLLPSRETEEYYFRRTIKTIRCGSYEDSPSKKPPAKSERAVFECSGNTSTIGSRRAGKHTIEET